MRRPAAKRELRTETETFAGAHSVLRHVAPALEFYSVGAPASGSAGVRQQSLVGVVAWAMMVVTWPATLEQKTSLGDA